MDAEEPVRERLEIAGGHALRICSPTNSMQPAFTHAWEIAFTGGTDTTPLCASGRGSVKAVPPSDNRAETREFLATRRAKLTPRQAGLLPGGGRGACPGYAAKRSPYSLG